MSAILDNITGGGLLPYVYCKKITLENSSEEGKIDVILSLELYQNKNALASSAWLNDLSAGGMNFLDAMFIQVLPFREHSNVVKLRPSTRTLAKGGNVYTGKHHFGDNYLPRDKGGNNVVWPTDKVFSFNEFPLPGEYPDAFQVSNSSLLGNIAGSDILLQYEAEGKVREEIVNGKPYYVIPFEFKETFDANSTNNNLGFAVYTFLDVPFWVESLKLDVTVDQEFFEQFVVEGPINTEVVFINGTLQQTREAFFLPDGRVWEGSVHLHASGPDGNPAPDGYSGNGGLSNLDIPSDFKGWMVGEEHNLAEEQPKLKLARVPNNKLLDLRSTTKGKLLEEVSAIGLSSQQESAFSKQNAFDKLIGHVGAVFQKEKRREFIIDNDSEYSKLYLTRDRDGNARGIFFINIEELLKNNSQVYPNMPGLSAYLPNIMAKSRFLELKIYRDRIKEHSIGRKREVYANDEIYEEPSKLVATLSPHGSTAAATSTSDSLFTAINISASDDDKIRYFMFADYNVAAKAAGLYQYRLEINFKDGTYEFLYDLYKQLANTKILLEQYYDLATSTYTDPATSGFAYTSYRNAKEFSKALFKQYFKNGSYDQQFALKANELFSENHPWFTVPGLLMTTNAIFLDFDGLYLFFALGLLTNKLDPVTGSPKGIENVTNLVSVYIKQLEKILEINKLKKISSSFTSTGTSGGFDSTSLLSKSISQANHTISEEHSFDHPAELFEAISNKNIYSEYLSLDGNSPGPSAGQALKSISVGDFRERCKAEVAKYSLKPLVPEEGDGPEYNLSEWFPKSEQWDTGGYKKGHPTLSDTGYSYLAPSVIELSTGVKGNNFIYRPRGFLATATQMHELYVALLNYSFSKEDEKNADLLDVPFSYDGIGVGDFGHGPVHFSLREIYKEVFEKLGMTVHDIALHDQFFLDAGHERESGAVSVDTPEAGFNIWGSAFKFQYKIEDFSDGLINPITFFKNFANNKQVPIKKLKAYDLSSVNLLDTGALRALPNNFKITRIRNNHVLAGNPELITTTWYGPDSTYLFFNLNLTIKIEVFRGSTGNAKYDEDSWSLLTKEDLDSISGTLLCRMSYFDEKLTKDLNLPMLDKYFLITAGGHAAADIPVEASDESGDEGKGEGPAGGGASGGDGGEADGGGGGGY